MDSKNVYLAGNVDYRANTSAPPVERDSVTSALNEQEKYAADLHSAISHLTEVLRPLLESEGPGPSNISGGPAQVAPVNVLARTRSNNRTISEAIGRINQLGARVQL